MDIKWNKDTENIFNEVLKNLPQFHRNIAKELVKEKAEGLAKGRESEWVENQDLITAFFQEVPPAFKDLMKRLFQRLNVDYTKFIGQEEKCAQQ